MCELYPRGMVKEEIIREQSNSEANFSRLEEEIGKDMIDQFDKCPHFAVSRLANGHFYCHRCQIELKLETIKH